MLLRCEAVRLSGRRFLWHAYVIVHEVPTMLFGVICE
jgi:hypothetical protein